MNNATFRELDIDAALLTTLASQELHTPTPVQSAAIPHILAGSDILASAQTGSGKTAAFVLPIVQRFLRSAAASRRNRPRALVLAPTRELAAQIGEVCTALGQRHGVGSAVLYGGVGKGAQIAALRRSATVVVATPGRLLDLLGEGALSLEDVEVLVLDEADRMLDMGFIPDVKRIISRIPERRQSLFFSATVPAAVAELSREFLKEPVRVDIEKSTENDPQINQEIMFVTREHKRSALRMVLTERAPFRALVFTRTKYKARDISRYLGKNGISSDDIHGDKSQNARTRALADFDSGKIQVLVATDIASRGIDIDDIDQVINFELPHEADSYVHRIGRTARAGKSGTAISLCDESELEKLSIIQKALKHAIPVVSDHPYHATEVAGAAAARSSGGSSRRSSGSRGPARRSNARKAGRTHNRNGQRSFKR